LFYGDRVGFAQTQLRTHV